MEFIYGILIALLGILAVIVIKLVTTFFHELGHAIPALIFTKKPVKVYVGSYGDISKTAQIKIGRLMMYLKFNIFDWKIGMCEHGGIKSNLPHALVILGGPLASLLVSIPLILNYSNVASIPLLNFLYLVFIASAVYDFIINMLPMSAQINMHDGGVSYSDGYQLLMLFNRSLASEDYLNLEEKFFNKEYETVVSLGEKLIKKHPKDRSIYGLVIQSLKKLDDPEGAIAVYGLMSQEMKLLGGDYFEIAKHYKDLEMWSEALKYFEIFRYNNYRDVNTLKEIGLIQMKLGRSDEAFTTYDRLVNIDPGNVEGRSQRSFLLINKGDYDFAMHDLEVVKQIDPNFPNLFFNLGLIEEKSNRLEQALAYYQKAKSLNCDQHGLDFRIETIRQSFL